MRAWMLLPRKCTFWSKCLVNVCVMLGRSHSETWLNTKNCEGITSSWSYDHYGNMARWTGTLRGRTGQWNPRRNHSAISTKVVWSVNYNINKLDYALLELLKALKAVESVVILKSSVIVAQASYDPKLKSSGSIKCLLAIKSVGTLESSIMVAQASILWSKVSRIWIWKEGSRRTP